MDNYEVSNERKQTNNIKYNEIKKKELFLSSLPSNQQL